jgi:hypothetical protein
MGGRMMMRTILTALVVSLAHMAAPALAKECPQKVPYDEYSSLDVPPFLAEWTAEELTSGLRALEANGGSRPYDLYFPAEPLPSDTVNRQFFSMSDRTLPDTIAVLRCWEQIGWGKSSTQANQNTDGGSSQQAASTSQNSKNKKTTDTQTSSAVQPEAALNTSEAEGEKMDRDATYCIQRLGAQIKVNPFGKPGTFATSFALSNSCSERIDIMFCSTGAFRIGPQTPRQTHFPCDRQDFGGLSLEPAEVGTILTNTEIIESDEGYYAAACFSKTSIGYKRRWTGSAIEYKCLKP